MLFFLNSKCFKFLKLKIFYIFIYFCFAEQARVRKILDIKIRYDFYSWQNGFFLRKNNFEFLKFRNLKIKTYLLYISHNIAKNLLIYPNLSYYLFLFIKQNFFLICPIFLNIYNEYWNKYNLCNFCFVYFKYVCQNRYKNFSSLLKTKKSPKRQRNFIPNISLRKN